MMRLEYRLGDVTVSWEAEEVPLGADVDPYLVAWRRAVEFAHEMFTADARGEREVARLAAGILPQREPEPEPERTVTAEAPAPRVFACPGCGDEVVAGRTADRALTYFDAESDPMGRWHVAVGAGDTGEDLAVKVDGDMWDAYSRQGRPMRSLHVCEGRD